MLKVGVLASGRGSNLQALLEAAAAGSLGAEIAVVLSDRAGAPALDRAKKRAVPAEYLSPDDYLGKEAYDCKLVERLKAYEVELVVLAGYMRLVTAQLLEAFPERIINIHPALLPAFPGLNAQAQALEYGVKYSGCTVHLVDGGIDSGPIIAQAVVPVKQEDTVETLAERILHQEHLLLPQVVRWFAQGKIRVAGRKVFVEAEVIQCPNGHC